jgi:hypothetical protein
MYNIVFTEIDLKDGCKHKRYIRFPLDSGKDFDYRARMSYCYFASGLKKRNWRPSHKKPEIVYSGHREDEWKVSYAPHNMAPVVDVGSIWEFYDLIGYNYKQQRWAKSL